MNTIGNLATLFDTSNFVFCWDSRKSKRREIYKEYKVKRYEDRDADEVFKDEQTKRQMTLLRSRVLPTIGFKNSFVCTGHEADDIIAQLCIKYHDQDMIIVSTDSDLYQCLTPTICMFRMLPSGKNDLVTNWDFIKKWNISPEEWAEVKAIAGDTSDNIVGVKGVAEKTACKYLKGELGIQTKAYANIKASTDIIERNRTLVTLPMKGTYDFSITEDEKLSLAGFIYMCNQYGFESYLRPEELARWRRRLNLG